MSVLSRDSQGLPPHRELTTAVTFHRRQKKDATARGTPAVAESPESAKKEDTTNQRRGDPHLLSTHGAEGRSRARAPAVRRKCARWWRGGKAGAALGPPTQREKTTALGAPSDRGGLGLAGAYICAGEN